MCGNFLVGMRNIIRGLDFLVLDYWLRSAASSTNTWWIIIIGLVLVMDYLCDTKSHWKPITKQRRIQADLHTQIQENFHLLVVTASWLGGEIPPLPHWSRPCLIVVVRLFPLSFPCYFLLVLLLLPSLDWYICLQLHAFLNSFHITPTSRLLVSFSSCYRTKYKFRRKMFILSDVTAWYVCTICFVL